MVSSKEELSITVVDLSGKELWRAGAARLKGRTLDELYEMMSLETGRQTWSQSQAGIGSASAVAASKHQVE